MTESETIAESRLREITRSIFAAAGASPENAARVAAALVGSNLAGHDSHGVIRIPEYVAAMRSGELVPDASPEVAHETPVSAVVNGNWTFGQVSAAFATRLAVRKARESLLAAVGIVRCHHTGRIGEYAEMAAAEGIILIVMGGGLGNTRPLAAPHGGRRAVLGANPIALGFPTDGARPPVIVDFATTVIAGGKIQVARAAGTRLPTGAILDRDGRPSTDPNDFYNGGVILPFGGHKGYALALSVELLTAALIAPGTWAEEGHGGPVFGPSGHFLLAISPAVFGARDEYLRVVEETLARIKAVPPAAGFTEVQIPGEPEAQERERRSRDGIPIAPATWQAITSTAADLGVAT